MHRLGPGTEAGFLQFDEVADVSVFADKIILAKATEGADTSSRPDYGGADETVLANLDSVGNGAVPNDAAGANAAVCANFCVAGYLSERANDRVLTDLDAGVNGDRFGLSDGDAVEHQLANFTGTEDTVGFGQFDAMVDAEDLSCVFQHQSLHSLPCPTE